MKPGRELDALVAEKVLGSERIGWAPSTDIAAAWELVEKLKDILKGEFCLSFVNSEWTVYRDWHTDSEPLGWAQTAPHAICLAALNVVGVELNS